MTSKSMGCATPLRRRDALHDLDTALKAKVVPAEVLRVNCPIVSIKG